MLPAWPGSQSGVSSEAPGSGLGPPSTGRGGPVVRRLWGVSMEVDHPAGRSRGRTGHGWPSHPPHPSGSVSTNHEPPPEGSTTPPYTVCLWQDHTETRNSSPSRVRKGLSWSRSQATAPADAQNRMQRGAVGSCPLGPPPSPPPLPSPCFVGSDQLLSFTTELDRDSVKPRQRGVDLDLGGISVLRAAPGAPPCLLQRPFPPDAMRCSVPGPRVPPLTQACSSEIPADRQSCRVTAATRPPTYRIQAPRDSLQITNQGVRLPRHL